MTKSTTLANLLPKRYRDKTIDTLIGNLFDQHLSKPNAENFHGYVGSLSEATADEIYLDETSIERQANQFSTALYSKAATDEDVTTWADLVQRMHLLGISYDKLANWFTVGAHNFTPPIDLDKFVNFSEYTWIAPWVLENPSLPYSLLGLPPSSVINARLAISNPARIPDYYVVARDMPNPLFTQGGNPASDWALCNLWVHKEDVIAFYQAHGSTLTLESISTAVRPIIELGADIKLNAFVNTLGEPCDVDTLGSIPRLQVKTRVNQPVQLDLHYHTGEHANISSAGFYYQESPDAPVDEILGRRVVQEAENFLFAHGFTHPSNGRLLWFKGHTGGGNFTLQNMWVRKTELQDYDFEPIETAQETTAEYVKYSTIGTVLNLDKLKNYQDYYWVNGAVEPEYSVLAGGTSDWALDNSWVHVANLSFADRQAATPAARPIIEFNAQLDAELLTSTKTERHELPRFKIYRRTGPEQLSYPSSLGDEPVNDSYTNGVLFARLEDLPADLQAAILGSSELSARLLMKLNGISYVQSLANGVYRPERDGIPYGFSSRVITRTSQGDGQMLVTSLHPVDTVPRLLKLTAINATSFSVADYKGASFPALTVNTNYILDGAEFTLQAGSQPFAMGDTLTLEIRSVVFSRLELYCKLDAEFKTFLTADGFLSDAVIKKLVPANIAAREGAWLVHPALQQNLDSENGLVFNQADLITHFAAIIGAQPTIAGNIYGRNNWRTILPDVRVYSLGGSIKQLDQRLALFLSTLLQPGITPVTLLESSKLAYDEMLARIREYVETKIIDDMVAGKATVAGQGSHVDNSTIAELIKYLEGTETLGDLGVGRPYHDTTMPIKALTLTGPYLGTQLPVLPEVKLDLAQGVLSIVHHDGHMSLYPTVDEAVIKKLVTKLFARSSGQITPGIVTGPTPPQYPFAKQLWLDLSSMTLFVFDVISDTFAAPASAPYGAKDYDRTTGEVFQFNGSAWVSLGNSQLVQDSQWRQVDLSKTLAELMLAIETKLYSECPTLGVSTFTVNSSDYNALMAQELDSFAAKHGITDPFGGSYDAGNSFTWNYIGRAANPLSQAWQQVYETEYLTSRPDLQPWAAIGMTETAFIAYMILQGALPLTATEFSITMWPAVAPFHRALLLAATMPPSNPGKLAVDTVGSLLPPFAFGQPEQLFITPPSTSALRFTYGGLGPTELMWTRTTDYQLAKQRSTYRLTPLEFTDKLWGDDCVTVSEYKLLESTGNKAKIADVSVHGEFNRISQADFIFTPVLSTLPVQPISYELEVIRTGLFKLSSSDIVIQFFEQASPGVPIAYSAGLLSFTLVAPKEGLRVGTIATMIFDDLGGVSITYQVPAAVMSSGLGQLAVHSLRRESIDIALTQALSKLTSWEPRLSYRFGALIDTSSLLVKTNDEEITKSSMRVLLDEVKHQTSNWYSALKITLHRQGAAERRNNIMIPALSTVTNRRGDDWVYRVDVLSQVGPGIQWYVMTDPGNTFIALGGKTTTDEWQLPQNTVGAILRQSKGPFLVTGIQNLINFLQGYAVRQAELGFRAGGTDEPVIDAEIGRTIDWQLLIEQTVDKQFTGIAAGAWSVLNPFRTELAFITNRGAVTSFSDPITDESLTPMLLDSANKRLPTAAYRVFRQKELTTCNFDQVVIGAHVMTSVYEHVLLLPYRDGSKLLFSPLLGQAVQRPFIAGERQLEKNGRLEFGGKFLRGNDMSENLEASVVALRNLYDTASLTADGARAARIRAMLGFHEQEYFSQRDTSSASEFRFFQGLLRAKGTNSAVDAYLNSRQFKSAYLDEFWAYKIASYGDGRPVINIDMKVGIEDFTGDYANFLFLEADELGNLDNWAEQQGYDVPNYDMTPYDGYSIYGPNQFGFIEYFDPNSAIIIRPDNPKRWYRYTDQNKLAYFEADDFIDLPVYISELNKPIRLKAKNGELVRADTFEVLDMAVGYDMSGYDTQPYDTALTNLDYLNAIYREPGDLIVGTDPVEYSTPVFRRVNHSTIVFIAPSMLGKTVLVRCYAPGLHKFTPVKLYRYKPEVIAASDDIIWWDPARGLHHPEAFAHVDHVLKRDPAIYNESLLRGEGVQVNAQRPWGEAEVGKVWWDSSQTAWLPYSDTKINPGLQDRLAQWGGIAEYSDLKLYEWIESSVPPIEYRNLVENGTASGEVGFGHYLYRDRHWRQRPVAWLFSDNPQQTPRIAAAYQTDSLNEVEYDGKRFIVPTSGVMPTELGAGVKIAAALYSTSVRAPAELVEPIGQLLITSDEFEFIVGSIGSFTTPVYSSSLSFDELKVTTIPGTLVALKSTRGKLIISNELINTVRYIRATFEKTGLTQRVTIADTPAAAGVPYELVFDNLGVKLVCRTRFGHTDTWSIPTTSEAMRIARVAIELGSLSHDIVIREALPIQVQIPTGLSVLPGANTIGDMGWIAWTDPVNVNADNAEPFNKYQPLFGKWVDVDTRLAELTADIKARLRAPWILRSGTVIDPYSVIWTRWKLFKRLINEVMYTTVGQTHDQALRAAGFINLPTDINFKHAEVFINGKKTNGQPYTIGNISYVLVNPSLLREGDSLRIIIPAYRPTAAELGADLTLATAEPSAVREFKLDTPYVKQETRTTTGKVNQVKYFYWVTGKETRALNKRMSTLLAQNLLRNHDSGYAVPQVFKSFNQVDGRPNRYAMLCVRGVSHLVGADDTFRLRLTRDPGMRIDSEDNHLKARHNEWVLIRPGQTTKIPKELWDKLVDTLCAETALGTTLPYVQLFEHDTVSQVKASYGLGEGQVLTDSLEAKATVLGTILNTRVERYDNELDKFVPDPISYPGFDINTLETRLSANNVREFMGELWLNAKPKQLNELFFAVLEDCLARNIELENIFKTSYIGLGEVRTLATPKLTTANTMFGTVTSITVDNNFILHEDDPEFGDENYNTVYVLDEDGFGIIPDGDEDLN